ncbi:hypothetical protein [Solilutibacter silvestris]|nr:hypothetical protein [Lysobacter silvestris]
MAALLTCGIAQAKGAGKVWQGTLGPNDIVVEIDTPAKGSADLDGRYFYRRHRMDIRLEGNAGIGGSIVLKEGFGGDDAAQASWRMQAPAHDRWEGEWIGPKGRRLPIRLHGLAAATATTVREPSLATLRGQLGDYAWLRLSELELQRGKTQQINGVTLQWLHQPDSSIDLFEVTSGYSAAQLQRINATLRKRLWSWVDSYYDCMSGARDGLGEFETTTTLRHVSPKIISASLSSNFYCGGAHPDFGDSPLNIDPRDGRELDLDDVLWLGPGKPLHAGKGDDWNAAWAEYRGKRFAPWVVARFKSLYPAEFKKGDDECSYDDPGVWDFAQWYATPKGIHLSAYFARVARACDDPDWAILPWKLVDAYPGAVRIH